MSILLLIFGLVLFVGLVVLHEFGHAIMARRNKVEVEEFGIGFPPRAWGKKLKNGTLFSLNWLPLGGFVKLKGEHDSATGPGTYGGATLWGKTQILLAGVVVNWVTAVLMFTVLALFGLPKVLPNQFSIASDTQVIQNEVVVGSVTKGSPAEKSGLQPGDRLVTFNGQHVTSATQIVQGSEANAGKTIDITYTRGKDDKKETKQAQVTLNKEKGDVGFLGIKPGDLTMQRHSWSAPIVGVAVTAQFTWETLKGLGGAVVSLFKADFAAAGASVAGPVGIFGILQTSSDAGLLHVLFLIGIISLTLAVMNVLPIPALDGGRLFVTLLFRVLKKPLTKEREEKIHATGFMALMILILVITVVDVRRLF